MRSLRWGAAAARGCERTADNGGAGEAVMSDFRRALAWNANSGGKEDAQIARLAERIRAAAENPQIGAPEIFDVNAYPSANLVAAYFDDPAPDARAQSNYEQQCLRSEVLMAEAACCFDILHFCLEQPVRVPKSCRQRLYAIKNEPLSDSDAQSGAQTSRGTDTGRGTPEYRRAEQPSDAPARLAAFEAYDRQVDFDDPPSRPASYFCRQDEEYPQERDRSAPRPSAPAPQRQPEPSGQPNADVRKITVTSENHFMRWTIQLTETIILTALVFIFLLWGIPWIRMILSGQKSAGEQQSVQSQIESTDAPAPEPDQPLSYASAEAPQPIEASRPAMEPLAAAAPETPPAEQQPPTQQPMAQQQPLAQPPMAEGTVPEQPPRVERLSLVPQQPIERSAPLTIPAENNRIFQ